MALKLLWVNTNPNPNPGGTEVHSVDFIRALENIKEIELYKAIAKGSFVDRHTSHEKKFHVKLRFELEPVGTTRLINIARKIRAHFIVGNNGNEYISTFLAGKLYGAKVLLFRHMLNPLPPLVVRYVLPYTYRVLAVSEASKSRLLKAGLPQEKVEVVPNFIDENTFATQLGEKHYWKKELGVAEGFKVITYLGKVAEGKGIYDFLKVAQSLLSLRKDLLFFIVGFGRELEKVKQWLEKAGYHRHFLITGKTEKPEKYLKASDILLVLSKDEESFGRVAVEGMATRNAVILYNVENLRNLVQDDVDGFVCERGNVEDVVERVLLLLKSPERLGQIAEAGFRTYMRNYTKEMVLRRFLSLLV